MRDRPNSFPTNNRGNVVAAFRPANDTSGIAASTHHAAAVLSSIAIAAHHLAGNCCTNADRSEFFRIGQSAFGVDTADLHRVSLIDAIELLIATHPDATRSADPEVDAISVELALVDVINARIDRLTSPSDQLRKAGQITNLINLHAQARAQLPPGAANERCAMDDHATQGAYDAQ